MTSRSAIWPFDLFPESLIVIYFVSLNRPEFVDGLLFSVLVSNASLVVILDVYTSIFSHLCFPSACTFSSSIPVYAFGF